MDNSQERKYKIKWNIKRNESEGAENSLRLLKISEVSKILGISKRTVYNYVKEGKLPCVKLSNRTLRFRETDLMKLISEKTITYEPSEKTDLIAKRVLEKILKRG
ncbi:helix-turn-helix transcriptional regulator [Thermodesulfovibrio yellowstonii]|uniref:helix-turn-helix transcriptional regulator n=1 Tax=Thermodesulfovibrio yellowstonii TaxID=28262 RepID=UPI003C7B148E